MCLQGSSSGFYGDNAREKFHRLKVKVNGAAGSLNASIMIFQGIKNGPNPEYFSENKQKLLTLLENIQQAMKDIKFEGMGVQQSYYDLCLQNPTTFKAPLSYQVTSNTADNAENFHGFLQQVSILVNEAINAGQRGKKEQIKNFLFNDTLGTIDEMRVQLEFNYDTKRFLFPVGSKNAFVDVMVILSEEDRTSSKFQPFPCKQHLTGVSYESSTVKRERHQEKKIFGQSIPWCGKQVEFKQKHVRRARRAND